jgi:hypothetical protein
MATIVLTNIHCQNKQDSISEDEIVVHVNGAKVAGPIGVHQGDTVKLGTRVHFDGTARVQLLELDANSAPDDLGTNPVNDAPVTDRTLAFNKASHASYSMKYSVTSS